MPFWMHPLYNYYLPRNDVHLNKALVKFTAHHRVEYIDGAAGTMTRRVIIAGTGLGDPLRRKEMKDFVDEQIMTKEHHQDDSLRRIFAPFTICHYESDTKNTAFDY
jgi:hypothetical protein